jgi:hypothetical protein
MCHFKAVGLAVCHQTSTIAIILFIKYKNILTLCSLQFIRGCTPKFRRGLRGPPSTSPSAPDHTPGASEWRLSAPRGIGCSSERTAAHAGARSEQLRVGRRARGEDDEPPRAPRRTRSDEVRAARSEAPSARRGTPGGREYFAERSARTEGGKIARSAERDLEVAEALVAQDVVMP